METEEELALRPSASPCPFVSPLFPVLPSPPFFILLKVHTLRLSLWFQFSAFPLFPGFIPFPSILKIHFPPFLSAFPLFSFRFPPFSKFTFLSFYLLFVVFIVIVSISAYFRYFLFSCLVFPSFHSQNSQPSIFISVFRCFFIIIFPSL